MEVIKVDELHEAISNIVSKQEFSHLVNELLIELDSVLETKSITIGWVPITEENMPKDGFDVVVKDNEGEVFSGWFRNSGRHFISSHDSNHMMLREQIVAILILPEE